MSDLPTRAPAGATDVIVCGAGPVGLTLALALATRGVRTIVLEKKRELDTHSRATLVTPRSLEILSGVGVLAAMTDEGQVNPALDILRAGDRRPLLRFDFATAADETAVAFAIAIPQDRTERILLDACRASGLVDVRFASPLQHFSDSGDGVEVIAGPHGDHLRARYLVGADGAHSAVRKTLGWTLDGTTYPTRAFLADVRVAPSADLTHGWLSDPKAAAFTVAVRFGGDATAGTWRLIEAAIPDSMTPADFPEHARAVTDRIFGPGAWRQTVWTSAYRKHERRAGRYRLGRVVLAGDAAHLNSPAGGQASTPACRTCSRSPGASPSWSSATVTRTGSWTHTAPNAAGHSTPTSGRSPTPSSGWRPCPRRCVPSRSPRWGRCAAHGCPAWSPASCPC